MYFGQSANASAAPAPVLPPSPCPTGWEVTANGNCGAPVADCPPGMRYKGACRSPAAAELQNAVRALGHVVNDPVLKKVGIDGIVNGSTVVAVNRAFTMHIGAGQAPADLRTGKLTLADLAGRAPVMTAAIAAEVVRRGGTVPAVPTFGAKSYAMWGLLALGALTAAGGAYYASRR